MKKIIIAAALLVAQSAMADKTVLDCVVPSAKNNVKLNMTLADDASADFIIFTLTEATGESTLYAQLEKGDLDKQMSQGFANMLVLTDNTAQKDGVILNSGFFAVGKEADGSYGGFLSAKGNVYPISCK